MAVWRRFPSGLAIAKKYASAFPRVASCDFASQSDLRSGYPRLRSAQQSGLPRELSPRNPRLCVPHRARRFKAATIPLLCRHTGRVTAAKPPKEKRGGFLPSKLGENLPRFSCPRNPLSVGLTFALSCGRGLTRPVSRQFAPAGRGGALPRIDGAAKVPRSKPRRGKCREKVPRSPAGGGGA